MPSTTRWGNPYPSLSDAADVPSDLQALAEALDNVAKDDQGAFASRPVSTVASPGKAGRYYYATDRRILYRDTGTSWVQVATADVYAQASLNGVVIAGSTLATISGLTAVRDPLGMVASAAITVPVQGYYQVSVRGQITLEVTPPDRPEIRIQPGSGFPAIVRPGTPDLDPWPFSVSTIAPLAANAQVTLRSRNRNTVVSSGELEVEVVRIGTWP